MICNITIVKKWFNTGIHFFQTNILGIRQLNIRSAQIAESTNVKDNIGFPVSFTVSLVR